MPVSTPVSATDSLLRDQSWENIMEIQSKVIHLSSKQSLDLILILKGQTLTVYVSLFWSDIVCAWV